MSEAIDESRALPTALRDFSKELSALEKAIARLIERSGKNALPGLCVDDLTADWGSVTSRYRRLQAEFGKLTESVEDACDLADALDARAEGGEPVALEDLKAELGIE
jgi:hypothetical protein